MEVQFSDYQARYASSFFPLPFRKKWEDLKTGWRRVVMVLEPKIQGTELVIKSFQLSVTVISYFSHLNFYLIIPLKFCKKTRKFTDFLKGLKSIDELLHFQFFWRQVILTLSGMTLFVVSLLELGHCFELVNMTAIKKKLAALPVVGVLPWGGLVPFSLVGLLSMVVLNSLKKTRKIEGEKNRIKNQKITFWNSLFDLQKVKEKQLKYQKNINELRKILSDYENLLQEGTQTEKQLRVSLKPYSHQRRACDEAIQELRSAWQVKQASLIKYEQKYEQWRQLEKQWGSINPQEIEDFRHAKQEKWKAKLDKLEREQRAARFAITSNSLSISIQLLTISAGIGGYGTLPAVVKLKTTIDVIATTCNIKKFFIQRANQKTETLPVELEQWIHLI